MTMHAIHSTQVLPIPSRAEFSITTSPDIMTAPTGTALANVSLAPSSSSDRYALALSASPTDAEYVMGYSMAHMPISLEGLPLANAQHMMANGYNVAGTVMVSPVATTFPSSGSPPQSLAPHLSLPPSATMATHHAYLAGPLSPMMPTVSGVVNQMSPTGVAFPEFQEYSRRHYELSTDPEARKRARMAQGSPDEDSTDDHNRSTCALNAELRRQIHIQSEQKRRAQIKDGFEHLREHLPSCAGNKKVSKAAILNKTVLFIQQLKHSHVALLSEVERLAAENERLRKRLGEESPYFQMAPKPYPNAM